MTDQLILFSAFLAILGGYLLWRGLRKRIERHERRDMLKHLREIL